MKHQTQEQEIMKSIIKKYFSPVILITGTFNGVPYTMEDRSSGKWEKVKHRA